MDKEKLPHELSLEELLKGIEDKELIDEKVEFSYDNPILSFLQAFKISEGKRKISDAVLYELYRLWHPFGDIINKRTFNVQLGKYIPSMLNNRRYYFVSDNVLKFGKEIQKIKKEHTRDKTKSIVWLRHIESFLSDVGLKPGPVFVEADILFYIYSRWLDSTRRTARVSYDYFTGICDLNFESKRMSSSKIKWFGVNNKIKESITREEVERWRHGRATYGKKKKDKEIDHTKAYKTKQKEILYPEKRKKGSSGSNKKR